MKKEEREMINSKFHELIGKLIEELSTVKGEGHLYLEGRFWDSVFVYGNEGKADIGEFQNWFEIENNEFEYNFGEKAFAWVEDDDGDTVLYGSAVYAREGLYIVRLTGAYANRAIAAAGDEVREAVEREALRLERVTHEISELQISDIAKTEFAFRAWKRAAAAIADIQSAWRYAK